MPPINTEINTDFIVEEYGRIYQQRGQGMDRIKRALIQKAVTLEKYATHKRLTDDIYEMANDEFQPVLQSFRVPFEPKGGVKFHPNKIVLQHIKVDLQFSPDQIIDSWLGFLEGEGVKREQWPITKYMIEIYLKQQIDYDREVNAVYYGVRNDAGTTPSACMDGIRKHLIDGANSQYPVNVISGIRRLQPDTCFDQVEAFSKKIKGIYRNVPIIICVSQDYERCFLENKRANGFYWLHGPEDLNASVDFTKQVVMGLPSMGEECGDMFAFVRGNLLWCTRKDKFNFDVQKSDRYVKVLSDWREGIGFGVNKMVWTTEETLGAASMDNAASEGDGPDGIVVRDIPVRVTSAKADSGNVDVSFKVNRTAVETCMMWHRKGHPDVDCVVAVCPENIWKVLSRSDNNPLENLRNNSISGSGIIFMGHLAECFANSSTATAIDEEVDRLFDELEDIGDAAFAKKYGIPTAELNNDWAVIRLAYDRVLGDVDTLDCRVSAGSISDALVALDSLRAVVAVKVGNDSYSSVPFPVQASNETYIDLCYVESITKNSASAEIHVFGGSDWMEAGYELYNNGTPASDTGSLDDCACAFSLSGLSASTEYQIRFYVKVNGVRKYTPWQRFTTLSA
ncbi:MAG: hypothetical protein IJK22_04255 [Bacteroidales bacterium]|nr:hypothetical protein [Bacteroidales bacterium]